MRLPVAPDRAALREAALRHLARFSASEAGVVRVLDRRIDRWARATGSDARAARALAREVAAELARIGAIDDAAYASARTRRLTRAGKSRRAIAADLAARGVQAGLPDEASEFIAALILTRRRAIGPFRKAAADPAQRMKEAAILARAGFSAETAQAALRLTREEATDRVTRFNRDR
jgi:regulatory protein